MRTRADRFTLHPTSSFRKKPGFKTLGFKAQLYCLALLKVIPGIFQRQQLALHLNRTMAAESHRLKLTEVPSA